MATISRLRVSLTANPNPLRRGLKSASESIRRFTGRIFNLKNAIVGALGVGSLGVILKDSLGAWQKQERAVAALDASIKSMGRNTKNLGRNIKDLAAQIQREGIIGDEAIIQGASFLTTYKEITDDMLPRTIRVMADLSAKMGGDVTRAANLLGKASMGLVGSLSIAGISLSERAKESKDFALILGEIEEQVGGMNSALGSTATGALTKFSNALGDLKEVLGGIVAIAIEPFMATLTLGLQGNTAGMRDVAVMGERLRRWMVQQVKDLAFLANWWEALRGIWVGVKIAGIGIAQAFLAIMHAAGKAINFVGGLIGFDDIISEKGFAAVEGTIDSLTKKTESLSEQFSSMQNVLSAAGFSSFGPGGKSPEEKLKVVIDEFAFQAEVDMMRQRLGLKPGGTFREDPVKKAGDDAPRTVRDPQLKETNVLLNQIRRDLGVARQFRAIAG